MQAGEFSVIFAISAASQAFTKRERISSLPVEPSTSGAAMVQSSPLRQMASLKILCPPTLEMDPSSARAYSMGRSSKKQFTNLLCFSDSPSAWQTKFGVSFRVAQTSWHRVQSKPVQITAFADS